MITAKELRKKYLEFFKEKEHAILPSAPIVPENDPTALFNTSGMQPLVPYLMGEKHPQGNRLADDQKCIRTIDIEEVGDTTHHTFFEMLGNWSLGDYFKKEAIEWSWEFLTSSKWLGLNRERIAVSVFVGDKDAPFDEEAFEIWRSLGIPQGRIAKLSKEDNWWGPVGESGPCGPDTEMFYWVGDPQKIPEKFDPNNEKWVEIWNDVFMQYNKKADGSFEPLKQKNVDTGMGLERALAAMNGLDDNYKTELFWPIIEKTEELSGKKYEESEEQKKSFRVIADHIKAAVFIAADGVEPSNAERGYVLRRLIRRAVRQARTLGIKENLSDSFIGKVQEIYQEAFPEVQDEKITKIIKEEEEKFLKTLEKGTKEFEKLIEGRNKIVLISSNADKIKEYREIIGDRVDFDYKDIDLPEIQEVDSKRVAEHKAREAFKILKRPIIVEDTALHLETWNGFPGALVKWFIKFIGLQGILDLVEGRVRNAEVVCVIGYHDGQKFQSFEGRIKGRITEERRGGADYDFGFDPIFVPEGYKKTFAELGEQKHEVSHRRKALEEFLENNPAEVKDSPVDLGEDVAPINVINGKEAFDLYQTYGFPIELVEEMAAEHEMKVDRKNFEKELEKHQELSRTASAGMFKGGLADAKEETTQFHTAAHLLLAGLRKVLGEHVHQKGSNINGERIRFDFSHPEKMTDEEKKAVEDYVNEAIEKKIDVVVEEMSPEEARKQGAEGTFGEKYGEVVKVFTINGYSKEICGGPHVKNTGDIQGKLKIKKEQSSSAGVRRIKAVLEA